MNGVAKGISPASHQSALDTEARKPSLPLDPMRQEPAQVPRDRRSIPARGQPAALITDHPQAPDDAMATGWENVPMRGVTQNRADGATNSPVLKRDLVPCCSGLPPFINQSFSHSYLKPPNLRITIFPSSICAASKWATNEVTPVFLLYFIDV